MQHRGKQHVQQQSFGDWPHHHVVGAAAASATAAATSGGVPTDGGVGNTVAGHNSNGAAMHVASSTATINMPFNSAHTNSQQQHQQHGMVSGGVGANGNGSRGVAPKFPKLSTLLGMAWDGPSSGSERKERTRDDLNPPPIHPTTAPLTISHPPMPTFLETPTALIVWRRLRVLISLLILQSLSQVVLQAFEDLITVNVVVPLFLTMLVGAGGNAGNQAAVTAITGLTSGEISRRDAGRFIRKEAVVGFICAVALGVMGFIRVFVFYVNEDDTPAPVFTTVFAISLSLFLIVFSSVVLGGALPFVLKRLGANVEHAAPMIQVIMDILGVTISCVICSAFLPSKVPPSPTATAVGGGDGEASAAAVAVGRAVAAVVTGAVVGGGNPPNDALEVLVGGE